jgi:cyanophycin synthetase
VPAQGQRVVLRNNANLSTGGSATDVTDDVHPEIAARAIEAAQTIGLHICGVDVVCETMLKPLEEQSGGIVEVNAAPGLRMHLAPSFGRPRNVGVPMVDELFAPGDDGRIPGGRHRHQRQDHDHARDRPSVHLAWLAHRHDQHRWRVRQRPPDRQRRLLGPKSARNALAHPETDAAVLECARGGILREGLGFDRCQVAVVTNMGEGDHLGLNFITTVEDVGVLKRVIVQNVAPRAMPCSTPPTRWSRPWPCLPRQGHLLCRRPPPPRHGHAPRPGQPRGLCRWRRHRGCGRLLAREHRAARHSADPQRHHHLPGGKRHGLHRRRLGRGPALADHPPRSGRLPQRQRQRPWPLQCDGLQGATIIADYGHNPDAIRALVPGRGSHAGQAPQRGDLGAGDRRDQDITEQTQILGKVFDDVVLYQDACQRGRVDGEVLALLKKGLEGAPRTSYSTEIHGEFLAIDHALARLQPGDLCLVLVDQVEEALEHLRKHVNGQ